jgi:hypothetical protein
MHALLILFSATLMFLTTSAGIAGTIKLKATSGQVGMACLEAGGTYTLGTGTGGYGCKTAKGEVKCDKSGNCTGTCSNCGKSAMAPIGGVLANSVARGQKLSPQSTTKPPVTGATQPQTSKRTTAVPRVTTQPAASRAVQPGLR